MKNKKTLFTSICICVLVLIASIFAFVPIERSYDNFHKNWMSKVDDSAKIRDLSLPGTHNSGAYHSIADIAGKCQDISISSQLNIGVRFLDIRVQMKHNSLWIVHNFVDQNLRFRSALLDLQSFLKENTEEFVLVSIKKESGSVSSTLDFNEEVKKALQEFNDVICLDSNLPETLGEVRGKAYILSRSIPDIGIAAHNGWEDDAAFELNNMYIQDCYNVQTVEEKQGAILETIDHKNANSNKLVLNFTSCYLDPGFPPSYAGTAALAINPWFETTISQTNDKLGIIVADFITEKLSSIIYMRNL